MTPPNAPSIAIACGGTGGHLFPGLAVAREFVRHGCGVTLIVSPKAIDQQAIRSLSGMDILTLPAVGLSRGQRLAFLRGFVRSYRAARRHFAARAPRAALAMGGFTGAPPILAAKHLGARTFLHESNTIPGRANRWLAWCVDEVFTGFPQAVPPFHHRHVTLTGTPVRAEFQPCPEPAACRAALGLDPSRPVLLVMGGSQGAAAINELMLRALPLFAPDAAALQFFHLAGPDDASRVRQAYDAHRLKAVVHEFSSEMQWVLGAATAAISRAGASSLAEFAAVRLPAVLIPYPAATHDHQLHNARAFAETGAARLLEQKGAAPDTLARVARELTADATVRRRMQEALAKWHTPKAASHIARSILQCVARHDAGPKTRRSRGTRSRHPDNDETGRPTRLKPLSAGERNLP